MDLSIESVVEPIMVREPELLLHPTLPLPLHGVNPRSILGRKWWDNVRQKAYGENNFHCMACGIPRRDVTPRAILHAHECYDINYGTGRVVLKRIVALCPTCHDCIHIQRMNSLYDKGEVNEEDMWLLLSHKERVLDGRSVPEVSSTVEWGDWYLELDGKKYFSKFNNIKEWREYYEN